LLFLACYTLSGLGRSWQAASSDLNAAFSIELNPWKNYKFKSDCDDRELKCSAIFLRRDLVFAAKKTAGKMYKRSIVSG
jgi:hypothetical protein